MRAQQLKEFVDDWLWSDDEILTPTTTHQAEVVLSELQAKLARAAALLAVETKSVLADELKPQMQRNLP